MPLLDNGDLLELGEMTLGDRKLLLNLIKVVAIVHCINKIAHVICGTRLLGWEWAQQF